MIRYGMPAPHPQLSGYLRDLQEKGHTGAAIVAALIHRDGPNHLLGIQRSLPDSIQADLGMELTDQQRDALCEGC